MNDLANKELRKLYHQVLKGLYRAKTIRENTDNNDIYSEFLLYDEDGNLIEETNVTSFESREIIKLLINSYENQLLKVGKKIEKIATWEGEDGD
nr:MAG TPA: Sep15/SelM redox domain [Caudoviricetes sp.]